jgi:AcrR family transcriptional regulator
MNKVHEMVKGQIMRQKVTSREQILEAAMEIAIREGVDHVSIRKLANACGIGVGSMYNYYPDKEALIAAVSEQFWDQILENQEMVYRSGMGFTLFLEQYYGLLYGRLSRYDKSWLAEMGGRTKREEMLSLLHAVLGEDTRVNPAIWNMELNQDAFCEYVFVNLMALLQAGENNCRFFIFLLEHLLYDV